MSLYNNGGINNARQLLNYANNLNVLSMSEDDLKIVVEGLLKTLQQEMKYAESTGDQQRYVTAQNMIGEVNSLTPQSINAEIVNILIKELIKLLTRQIQENSGTSNSGLFGTSSLFNNNVQQQNNIASNGFGLNSGGMNTNTLQSQSSGIMNIKTASNSNTNHHSVKQAAPKRKLSLEEVVDTLPPSKGSEFPPLYDPKEYKLWYEITNGTFEYILIEKDK